MTHLVPMHTVFHHRIKRRQIKATTKPPNRLVAFFFRDKHAHVGMTGWHVGIGRMNHQRDTECLRLATGKFRVASGGSGWQMVDNNVAKHHPAFFDHFAALKYIGATTAQILMSALFRGSFPNIGDKFGIAGTFSI